MKKIYIMIPKISVSKKIIINQIDFEESIIENKKTNLLKTQNFKITSKIFNYNQKQYNSIHNKKIDNLIENNKKFTLENKKIIDNNENIDLEYEINESKKIYEKYKKINKELNLTEIEEEYNKKWYNKIENWGENLLKKKRNRDSIEEQTKEYYLYEQLLHKFTTKWEDFTHEEKLKLDNYRKKGKFIDYNIDEAHFLHSNNIKIKQIKVKKLIRRYDKYPWWQWTIPIWNAYLQYQDFKANKTLINNKIFYWEETLEEIKYNPKTGRFDSFVNPNLNKYNNYIIYDKNEETIIEFNQSKTYNHKQNSTLFNESENDIYDQYDYENVKERIEKGYSFGGTFNILRKTWWYSSTLIHKGISLILKPVKWTLDIFGLFPNNPITKFSSWILSNISQQTRLNILAITMGIEYIIHGLTDILIFIFKLPKYLIMTLTFIFKHKGILTWGSTMLGLITSLYGYTTGEENIQIWGELLLRYGSTIDLLISMMYDVFGRGRSPLEIIRTYGMQNILSQIILRILIWTSLYRWQNHGWNEIIQDPNPNDRQGVNNFIAGRAINVVRYLYRWMNPMPYFLNFIPGFNYYNLGDLYSRWIRNYIYGEQNIRNQYFNRDRYNVIMNDPRIQRLDQYINNVINRRMFEGNIGAMPNPPDLGGNINQENINIDYLERIIRGAAGAIRRNQNYVPERINIEGEISLTRMNEMFFQAFRNVQQGRIIARSQRLRYNYIRNPRQYIRHRERPNINQQGEANNFGYNNIDRI